MDSPDPQQAGRDWLDIAFERWPILSWMVITGAVGAGAALYFTEPHAAGRLGRIATWAAAGSALSLVVGLTFRHWSVAKWLWGIPLVLVLAFLEIDRHGWGVLWWGLALVVALWLWNVAATLINEHLAQQRRIIEQLEELNRRLGG